MRVGGTEPRQIALPAESPRQLDDREFIASIVTIGVSAAILAWVFHRDSYEPPEPFVDDFGD